MRQDLFSKYVFKNSITDLFCMLIVACTSSREKHNIEKEYKGYLKPMQKLADFVTDSKILDKKLSHFWLQIEINF